LNALAQRYAGALVEVALEKGQATQVKDELAAFAALVRESEELHALLANPAIARASKHAVIEQLVARMGASRTLRNYLFVIVDQRRAGLLVEIEEAFSAILDMRMGVTQATVTSAGELTEAERAELATVLAKLTGKKVQAQFQTDAALIGGAVVRIGSTIYDGSVRAKLDRLRVRMITETE
jgi:F-type H+-transporting ATPase subunit delta